MRHPLAEDVSAARLVGLLGNVACLRLEKVTSTPEITVERRAVCVDAISGDIVVEHELADVGLYLPRRELAVGGGYLAFIRPTAAGLELKRFALPRPGMAVPEVQP